jgi:hypothetical protein
VGPTYCIYGQFGLACALLPEDAKGVLITGLPPYGLLMIERLSFEGEFSQRALLFSV